MSVCKKMRARRRVASMSDYLDGMAEQLPDEAGWRNIAYDVYKIECGEAKFDKQLKEFNKPPPAPGIFASVKLKSQTKKIQGLFTAKALLTSMRATHPQGVGGMGSVTILKNDKIPENPFFEPGKMFLARVRHSNLLFNDDAKTDIRGMAIKFADSDDDSPFDIIANTGASGFLWNVHSLYELIKVVTNIDDVNVIKEYMLISPEHLRVNIDGNRRAPDSYTSLRYYSQVPLEFKANDKVKRYAKFRVIPADGRLETGKLTEEEQYKPWEMDRSKDDTRSTSYLRDEYKALLSQGPIKYSLQIQLHVARSNDPWDIFHSGRAWNETTHPWLDFGDVTMTSFVDDDVIEGMSFNVGNVPSSLELLPAESVDDFRCINVIRKRVYPCSRKVRRSKLPSKPEVSYIVRVETGEQKNAETRANISIVLTGTKMVTDVISLGSWFRLDFQRGQVDKYTVKMPEVGELLMIKLINEGALWTSDDWFVNKVSVTDPDGKEYEFPCYRWVVDELVLYGGKATLPYAAQPEVYKAYRGIEVQKRREEYKWKNWGDNEDLPGCINAKNYNEIPRDSQFSAAASKSFIQGMIDGVLNDVITLFRTLGEPWNDFDDFDETFSEALDVMKCPKIIKNDNWLHDEVFGMIFLNGVNPLAVERCVDKLPENFPLTEERVVDLLDRGKSLSQEIKDGHIYKVDYKILEGIKRYKEGCGTCEERFVGEPIALFYVNKSGKLMPIAIQVRQEPGEWNPIWTPHDVPNDWLYAKMWLKNADLQVHQMLFHLLRTHFMMEPFAVAAWRQLPSIHPVFRLMFPHIRSIMAINTIGRDELVSKGGLADQVLSIGGGGQIKIMNKFYKQFTWDIMDLPALLKKQGVDDATKLPGFYYRDDALCLWKAIKDFITEFIVLFYESDKDVSLDTEIQAWVKDVHENGYPSYPGDVNHGFPAMLTTRDQLVHLLTCVVFNCSCQHAAVNFGQFEVYAYMPNTPCCMHLPPPTTKGVVDMKTMMEALPTKQESSAYLGLMHVLTRYAPDEQYIGDYSEGLFVDVDVFTIVERFQTNLQEISGAINKRNEGLSWPYTYLLPEKVPNSIAV